MSKPKASVLITSYNHDRFIEQAILSAVTQDYENLQVVVSDDGSTDRSPEIITDLKSRYPARLDILLNQDNLGITGNYNRGLRLCKGELLFFLDGDDFFLPGKISAQVDFMNRHPHCTISYHNIEVYDAQTDTVLYNWKEKFGARVGNSKPLIRYGNFLSSCAVGLRQPEGELIFYDERIPVGSDWLFYIDVLKQAKDAQLLYFDQILSRYRRHGQNVTLDWETKIRDQIITLDIVEEKYPEEKDISRLRRSEILFIQAIRLLVRGSIREGFSKLWRAFWLSGPNLFIFLRLPVRELRFILAKAPDPLLRSLFRT